MLLASTIASLLLQQDFLTEIQRAPVERAGTVADIAAAGRRCIAEHLGSGVAGGELIVSDSGNVIVARNSVTYSERFVPWRARSRLSFEAREGRFRITQTGLERFNEMAGGWAPIGKWRGSGWQRAERAFNETAAAVESCVVEAATDGW